VFVSDHGQVRAFDRVFTEIFGTAGGGRDELAPAPDAPLRPAPADDRSSDVRPRSAAGFSPQTDPAAAAPSRSGAARPPSEAEEQVPVPTLAADDERLREKRFDALDPDELVAVYRLIARLAVATPQRRTRRARRDPHGGRVDLRRTLRAGLRTGGDPVHLARRDRRVMRRRLVLLCDISGSMEPYARAYLQFLASASAAQLSGSGAGTGFGAEAFVFATRLTRLTRALRTRSPERAIQRAAATAPDWASGTRIGDALKTFNDRHGRRGMARGAVVVIISDGWERGDPELVGREMARLARLAHRIVWVNPRAAAAGFAPRAGGMAAALPHCDALVSGHSLSAMEQVIAAIAVDLRTDPGAAERFAPPAPEPEPEDEPWASATPVAGSSVAMPSGYSPSRGHTTPGRTIP
jgi:uncharacterized protein with von Willebrand factor type A (vWA) domain